MFYLRGDFPYAQHLVTMTTEGRALGDVTTLADPSVVKLLKDKYEDESA